MLVCKKCGRDTYGVATQTGRTRAICEDCYWHERFEAAVAKDKAENAALERDGMITSRGRCPAAG